MKKQIRKTPAYYKTVIRMLATYADHMDWCSVWNPLLNNCTCEFKKIETLVDQTIKNQPRRKPNKSHDSLIVQMHSSGHKIKDIAEAVEHSHHFVYKALKRLKRT